MGEGTIVIPPKKFNPHTELARLEVKRTQLHAYILMKLEELDYHGIADAAMDLRELDARAKAIKDWLDGK